MGKVALEGLEFFAYHGHYDEEQKIGNKYGVDIHVETSALHDAGTQDRLAETIDYEKLYTIIKEEMKKPSRLLENIAQRIIKAVFISFPQVEGVEVVVSKFNPPIGGICRRAAVTLSDKR
jgi:7,8-dihydroneopterin aldolase/epimerase/oxygenase